MYIFQLTFSFIYSSFSKKFSVSAIVIPKQKESKKKIPDLIQRGKTNSAVGLLDVYILVPNEMKDVRTSL